MQHHLPDTEILQERGAAGAMKNLTRSIFSMQGDAAENIAALKAASSND